MCPTYRYEEEIIATQVRNNLTFKEAKHYVSERFVRPRRPYSAVVVQQPVSQKPEESLVNPVQSHAGPVLQRPSPISNLIRPQTMALTQEKIKMPMAVETANRFLHLVEEEDETTVSPLEEAPPSLSGKRAHEKSPKKDANKRACLSDTQQNITEPPTPYNSPTKIDKTDKQPKSNAEKQIDAHGHLPKQGERHQVYPRRDRSNSDHRSQSRDRKNRHTENRNLKVIEPLIDRFSSSSRPVKFNIPARNPKR